MFLSSAKWSEQSKKYNIGINSNPFHLAIEELIILTKLIAT